MEYDLAILLYPFCIVFGLVGAIVQGVRVALAPDLEHRGRTIALSVICAIISAVALMQLADLIKN